MKKLFLLIVLCLGSFTICIAKPAQIIYYIMDQTMDSVSGDGSVSITYKMESPWLQLKMGNAGFPQPRLHIIITNNSTEDIILDLSKTTLIENGIPSSLANILSLSNAQMYPQNQVTIPAKQAWQITNINFLPFEYLNIIHGIYKYDYIGAHKNLGQKIHAITPMDVGAMLSYGEMNTPLTLSTNVCYKNSNSDVECSFCIKYYIKYILGTKLSIKSIYMFEDTNLLTERFPKWDSPEYLHFKLWRNSLKD